MKALSFRQPWAELILRGRKTIDLRTWPTRHRGLLAIHASQQVEVEICRLYNLDPAILITGALVGTVEVVEMVPLDDEKWESLRDQHLKPGPFPGDLLGWRLHDPQRLPQPVPMSGRLGLFNIPDELFETKSPTEAGRPETGDRRQEATGRRSAPVLGPRSHIVLAVNSGTYLTGLSNCGWFPRTVAFMAWPCTSGP